MKRFALSLFALAALWLLIVPVDAALTTNSWTNSVSSKWEGAINWSAGAPTNSNAANLITNASNKTVTVDGITALSNTVNGCMTISNLTVQGFGARTNTLELTGSFAPLRILNSLTVG